MCNFIYNIKDRRSVTNFYKFYNYKKLYVITYNYTYNLKVLFFFTIIS